MEQKYVKEAFDTNWVVPLGPNVNGFEKDLEDFVNNPTPNPSPSGVGSGCAIGRECGCALSVRRHSPPFKGRGQG